MANPKTKAVHTSTGLFLSDGSRLAAEVWRSPTELRIGQWVGVDDGAYPIVNLRAVGLSGRWVELCGYAPLYVAGGKELLCYEVIPPPGQPTTGPGRRRAVPAAGRSAPGCR
jgi:hypothetical protein